MANPNKRRGDRAELEVQQLIRDHLGIFARRALGAGRKDDHGDIHGLPDTVVQVANWANVAAAVREKPVECERQQLLAGATHGVTAIRLRGGTYRWVLTDDQFFTIWREATA